MAQVYWTEYTMETFLTESNLKYRSDSRFESQKARDLITTLKMHICDSTNAEISEKLHIAESRVDEYIRELKEMYDDIVYYTYKLIPRTNLTAKDKDIQIERYGFVLTAESIRKHRGLDR